MEQYWKDPGALAGAGLVDNIHTDRFLGIVSVFVQAAFSFQGMELVAVAASETESPRRNIAKAVRRVFYRIIIFYILGIIVTGMLVPYTDTALLHCLSFCVITRGKPNTDCYFSHWYGCRVAIRYCHAPCGHQDPAWYRERRRFHQRALGGQLLPVRRLTDSIWISSPQASTAHFHLLHKERSSDCFCAHYERVRVACVYEHFSRIGYCV